MHAKVISSCKHVIVTRLDQDPSKAEISAGIWCFNPNPGRDNHFSQDLSLFF